MFEEKKGNLFALKTCSSRVLRTNLALRSLQFLGVRKVTCLLCSTSIAKGPLSCETCHNIFSSFYKMICMQSFCGNRTILKRQQNSNTNLCPEGKVSQSFDLQKVHFPIKTSRFATPSKIFLSKKDVLIKGFFLRTNNQFLGKLPLDFFLLNFSKDSILLTN